MTFGCLGPKDFKPAGKPIPSPDGELLLIPMANKDYTDAKRGRLLTFDVRDANGDFRHHVQTDAQWTAEWVLGWHDDNTQSLSGVATSAYACTKWGWTAWFMSSRGRFQTI